MVTMEFFGSPKRSASARNTASLWVLLIVLCSLSIHVRPAAAQTSKGILTGVVRDSTGAVLPNATVAITNQDTSEPRTVTPPSAGAYRAEAINPGRYHIHVSDPGFAAVDVK